MFALQPSQYSWFHCSCSDFVHWGLRTSSDWLCWVKWTLDKLKNIFSLCVLTETDRVPSYSVKCLRIVHLSRVLFLQSWKESEQHCSSLLVVVDEWSSNLQFHSIRNILTSLPLKCHESWKLYSGGRLLNFRETALSASRTYINYQLIQRICFLLPTRSWHYKYQRLICCYKVIKWRRSLCVN